jgi:rod shape-determining protein MreD
MAATAIRRFSLAAFSTFTLLLIVVVQGILAHRFRFFHVFDLPLIYCVYYGFTRSKPIPSVFIGSILGLMQDSLSGAAMGTNGFSKALVCFAAASTSLKFNVDQPFTRAFGLFLFTFADGLVVTILTTTMGALDRPGYGTRFVDLTLSAIFNTLLGLIMFGVRDRFRNAT